MHMKTWVPPTEESMSLCQLWERSVDVEALGKGSPVEMDGIS